MQQQLHNVDRQSITRMYRMARIPVQRCRDSSLRVTFAVARTSSIPMGRACNRSKKELDKQDTDNRPIIFQDNRFIGEFINRSPQLGFQLKGNSRDDRKNLKMVDIIESHFLSRREGREIIGRRVKKCLS